MTIREALQGYSNKLIPVYDAGECRSITEIVMMYSLKISKSNLLANEQRILTDIEIELLENIFARLKTGEPVQYVLGEAWFCHLPFYVDRNVLIPRPETEELVYWIINDINAASIKKNSYRILDIGTGSGCIAIALKKNLNTSKVTAIDISEASLEIARKNALLNHAEVDFHCVDIFSTTFPSLEEIKFDVIVSNPPYVLNKEKDLMHKNVVQFEPHQALFVDDNNPLIFYEKIASFAKAHLGNNGKLYFEINENKSQAITELLQVFGFDYILLKKDIFNKDRMISCQLLKDS